VSCFSIDLTLVCPNENDVITKQNNNRIFFILFNTFIRLYGSLQLQLTVEATHCADRY